MTYYWIDPVTLTVDAGSPDEWRIARDEAEELDRTGPPAMTPSESNKGKLMSTTHWEVDGGWQIYGHRAILDAQPPREYLLALIGEAQEAQAEELADHSFVTNSGETVVSGDSEFAARARGETDED